MGAGGDGEDSMEPEDEPKVGQQHYRPGQDESQGPSAQAEGVTPGAHTKGSVGSESQLDSVYNCIICGIKYFYM